MKEKYMKSTKFFKAFSDEAISPEDSFGLLLDPIRSKIVLEIVLKGEITAESLVGSTGKSRSTISHHLKKLVESGILDVYMSPTGKTKHYRITQDIAKFMYTLDKEKLASGTLEEQTTFLIEMGKVFTVLNHIYANTYSDQMQLFQKHQPFDKINISKDKEISFEINKRRISTPYITFFITGEEQANFVKKGLKQLFKDFNKEFKEFPDRETVFDVESKFIVNLQILPYVEKEDLEE